MAGVGIRARRLTWQGVDAGQNFSLAPHHY
jgi:hypothetical protein